MWLMLEAAWCVALSIGQIMYEKIGTDLVVPQKTLADLLEHAYSPKVSSAQHFLCHRALMTVPDLDMHGTSCVMAVDR